VPRQLSKPEVLAYGSSTADWCPLWLAGQPSGPVNVHDGAPAHQPDDQPSKPTPAARRGRGAAAAAAANGVAAAPTVKRSHKDAATTKATGAQLAVPDPEQLRAQR